MAGLSMADDHPVILLYHHVSEETPASTSVSPAVFDQHLEYLAQHNFTVLPLGEIMLALQNDQPLPEKTIGLRFDLQRSVSTLKRAKLAVHRFRQH